jgi:hypothetical protein
VGEEKLVEENLSNTSVNCESVIEAFGNLLENGVDPFIAFKQIEEIFGEEQVEEIMETIDSY